MYPVHAHHSYEHDRPIKNVQESFVRHDIAVVTLKIFDHADDRPHKNQGGYDVEADEMFLPRAFEAQPCRCFGDSHVEYGRCKDEEAEEYQLNEQAGHDDVLAGVDHIGISTRKQTSPARLEQKAEDVSGHKHLREPRTPNEESPISFDHVHNPCQFHVYRRSEEGGGDKEQDSLDDVRAQRIRSRILCSRAYPASIAYCFEYAADDLQALGEWLAYLIHLKIVCAVG